MFGPGRVSSGQGQASAAVRSHQHRTLLAQFLLGKNSLTHFWRGDHRAWPLTRTAFSPRWRRYGRLTTAAREYAACWASESAFFAGFGQLVRVLQPLEIAPSGRLKIDFKNWGVMSHDVVEAEKWILGWLGARPASRFHHGRQSCSLRLYSIRISRSTSERQASRSEWTSANS